MHFLFCKKSVFSVVFFASFLIGTICGILLFRCSASADPGWIAFYFETVDSCRSSNVFLLLFFWAIPFLAAFVAGLLWPHRLLPVVVALRGLFFSYYLCARFFSGSVSSHVMLRSVILLPLFYLLCQTVWVHAAADT